MDFGALAKTVWDQFVTVWHTPVPFLAALFASWFVMRWFIKGQYETRLANAASKFELADARVHDYERKLAGATPEEAASRIDALEQAVAGLMPRRFSQEQLAIVLNRLRGGAGRITVMSEMGYSDGQVMSDQLAKILADAGFQVSTGGIGGPPVRPPQGLMVRASQAELGLALTSALDEAKIAYTLVESPPTTPTELQFIQPPA
jgi:hypothetical protein